MRRVALALLIVSGSACGGDDDGGGDDDTIRGTQIDRFIIDRGPVERANDLRTTTIAAIVEDAAGTVTVFPGTGTAEGTFEIPGVPEGRYLLRVGSRYLETEERSLALGRVVLGRPDAVPPAQPTALVLDAASAPGWAAGDLLDLTSTNAGLLVNELEAVPGAPIDWDGLGAPLIDAGSGDAVLAAHLVATTTASGSPYVTVAELAALAPFTMVDGQTTTASGTFSPAPSLPVSFTLDRAPFVTMIPAVHPGALTSGACVDLWAQPPAVDSGTLGALLFSFCPGNAAAGIVFSGAFGDPYPAGWSVLAETRGRYVVTVKHPDATTLLPIAAVISAVDRLAGASATVGARLGPPAAITLNGADATAPTADTGVQPILGWTAPLVGVATDYVVSVYQITNQGGATRRTLLARFQTTSRRLRLPAGVLAPDGLYLARIDARARSSVDPTAPFQDGPIPAAIAAVFTALFSPGPADLPGAVLVTWTVNGAAGHCPASGLGVMTVTVDTDLANPHVTPCDAGALQLELPAGTYGLHLSLTDPATPNREATADAGNITVGAARRTQVTLDLTCPFCP